MTSKIRTFDFVTGVETSTAPTAGTPTLDDDIVTKGYADDHYVQGGESLADLTALKAVAAADRADGDVVLVRSTDILYAFDSGSAATGDDNFVVVPDAGTGRWLRTPGDVATLTDSQVITNKDIDGGTASNTSRLTIPKGTKTALDALTRKEGTVVYATDLQKFFLDDGTNLVEVSGAGAGGINHITNPDAEVNADDWNTYADAAGTEPVDGTGGSANVTFTRTTTASEIGRGDASFELAKDAANRQGEGVSTDFTLPNSDQNKQLTVSFEYQTSANYAAADIGVYLIRDTGGTPAVVSPSTIDLPASPGGFTKFLATFVTNDDDDWRLAFHVASTNASAYDVQIDNVIVGPQENSVMVPASTDWEDYTPTLQNGTNVTINKSRFKRIGDSILINFDMTMSANGSGGTFEVGLPDGLTKDTTKIDDTADHHFGFGQFQDSSAAVRDSIVALNSTGQDRLNFAKTINTSFGFAGSDLDSGDKLSFDAIIPIAEYAGSSVGVTNSVVEYAYNSSTATAADDTSSFAYGPSGALIQNITATLQRRVRFRTPIQPSDVIKVQIDIQGDDRWTDIDGWASNGTQDVSAYQRQDNTDYGFGMLEQVSGSDTDIDVFFSENRSPNTSGGYAAAGFAWSSGSVGTTAKWRLVKSSNPIPVRCDDINTFVSDTQETSFAIGGSGFTEVCQVALTRGVWEIWGNVTSLGFTNQARLTSVITTTVAGSYTATNADFGTGVARDNPILFNSGGSAATMSGGIHQLRIEVTSATTYRLHALTLDTSAAQQSSNVVGSLYARRIHDIQ